MTRSTRVRLIGVDWSAVESKRGIAVVDFEAGRAWVVELFACTSRRTALHVIASSIVAPDAPTLIAIDAPLGWPVGLTQSLIFHSAGEGLSVIADQMFSRDTDRFVQKMLKKRPLEVGANLIARTAHSANQFLCDLRAETSRTIPLLWSPDDLSDVGVIEVYPAATKISANRDSLPATLGLADAPMSYANKHVEDALWCAAAAVHFVCGECHLPLDEVTSRREGWIWFRGAPDPT